MLIKGGKTELKRHQETKKHTKEMRAIKGTADISVMLSTDNSHKDNVKMAEIKLATFFATNNVPFHVIDELEPLMKKIFPDSKICADLHIKRTKCTEIIKNVVCKKETADLVAVLKNSFFSVLLDESTDIGDTKSLCVLVRYIDNEQLKVKTRLLELIEMKALNLGASELYATFKECLEKFGIPLNNIIGKNSTKLILSCE